VDKGEPVEPNATQLSAMARFFSSAVFRDMARTGQSPLFALLLGMTDLLPRCGADATVGEALDSAFSVLKRVGHRHEYV
jgi:hypothetical protein